MSDVDAWTDMMADTVTIAPRTGLDAFRKPTYGPAKSYRARIMGSNRRVTTAQGQEVGSSRKIILATTDVINVEDQVTLPDNFSPRQPPILSVSPVRDESGPHHVALLV